MKANVVVVTLLAVAVVSRVRSATVQLPVFGSGAFFYEQYSHNPNPEDPKFCDPWQATYNRSECFNLVEYLTIPMGIGNPEQKFNLTLDGEGLLDYDVLVFSEGAVHAKCPEDGASGRPIQGRRLFRSSRSTTFRTTGEIITLADEDRYYQNTCVADEPYEDLLSATDDFKVAGKSAQKVPLAVAKNVQATVQPFWPMYRIASSIGQPQLTLYMKRTSGYTRGDRVGTLTFGGRDAKNCDKTTWTDLPVAAPVAYTFNTKVQSVSLGSAEVFKNFSKAFFQFTYPTIGVPLSMFASIGEGLNATFDPRTQFYVIPCGSVKDAPPLTFHMEGLDYVIPAVDYIRNLVPRSDNMCTVLTESNAQSEHLPNGQTVELWVLGVPAMRSFCWNFDYDTGAASVAQAIQDN